MSRIKKWAKIKLYDRAAGIICQTQVSKSIMEKLTRNNNITVIPNPIKRFTERETTFKRENIVLNIGRMIESKKQDKLIEIFSKINSNWKLVFIGDGKEKKRYDKLVNNLDLRERVEFISATTDIEKYLKKAKIFAFTSISEGFPNTLAEAMLYPVATISYDCIAGPSELIINGENGYLVDIDDDENYKKYLSLLLNNSEIRDKFEKNAILLRNKYNIQNIGQQYYDFITKLYN